MRRVSLLVFSLFLTSSAYSFSLRGFCFDRSTSLKSVKNYVSQIIAPGDKIILNNSRNCVEVAASEERMDLFEKFISMNFKITKTYGNNISSRKECLFEIDNLKISSKTSSNIEFSNSAKAKSHNKSRTKKTISTLRMMERKPSQLYVNENLVTITCSPRGKLTEVTISLGSKKTNVLTTLEMRKDQRVNLASIVDKLEDDNGGIRISTGQGKYKVSKKSKNGRSREDFFLTLK